MRKIFTLFTMCMLAASAWAIDITFDATVDVGTGSSTAGEFTITKDGITLHEEQGVANGSHYRFYKNKKVVITNDIGVYFYEDRRNNVTEEDRLIIRRRLTFTTHLYER